MEARHLHNEISRILKRKEFEMSKNTIKSILIFQGSGTLGAYECGAFKVIAPYLDDKEELEV